MDLLDTSLKLDQHVVAAARAAIAVIDEHYSSITVEKVALQDLRTSLESLKRNVIGYAILLGSVAKMGAEKPSVISLSSSEGQEALRSLDVSLKAAKLLLEHNQVDSTKGTSINHGHQDQAARKRSPIRELVLTLLKSHTTREACRIDHDIHETSRDLEVCTINCENAFKTVWHLYIISQHQRAPSDPNARFHQQTGELGQALNDVLECLRNRPFSVTPEGNNRVKYTTVTNLNRNHQFAGEYEKLARAAGREWVQQQVPRVSTMNGHGKTSSNVEAIGLVQSSLLEILWTSTVELLKRQSAGYGEDPAACSRDKWESEWQILRRELAQLERILLEAILRAKKQRFAIAFCGMVKAGKSLFLNALIGDPVLPSDELPSTAWPCRLRHVPGQRVPRLDYDDGPFIAGLAALQAAHYGVQLEAYEEPEDDQFGMMSEEEPPEPTPEQLKLKSLYERWIDLHWATRENLLEFEKPGFRLPKSATGYENVRRLLSQLNDIVRLCHRFNLNFRMEDVEWPLLTVEFYSMRDHQIDGVYEFIDLPGIGEHFDNFDFKTMISQVAKESNAIVPVVSFKELARSDWKELPKIVANGFNGRASVVVCTHLDQIKGSNKEEQMSSVTKVFWPGSVSASANSIIPCSSLLGLSAEASLAKSKNGKPQFDEIWEGQMEYPSAVRILGTAEPQEVYDRMDATMWRGQLKRLLVESGLPDAIKMLTRDMVDQAKQRAFLLECEGIRKQLRKISDIHERKLLEARRSKEEFFAARKHYGSTRAAFLKVMEGWSAMEQRQRSSSYQLCDRAIELLQTRLETAISGAIKSTLIDWGLSTLPTNRDDDQDGLISGKGPSGARLEGEGDALVLILESEAHVEEFLRLSQSHLHANLHNDRQDLIESVRKWAEDAKTKRFRDLIEAFGQMGATSQPALRDSIIEELKAQEVDVGQLVFSHVRSEIRKVRTKRAYGSAFKSLEARIARPFLRRNANKGDVDGETTQPTSDFDDLAFILRAPITLVATVPFVLGLPFRRWKAHSRLISMSLGEVESRYRLEVVDPWLKALKEESSQALAGTISATSEIAKATVLKVLKREDELYERENYHKSHAAKKGLPQHMVAMQSNLFAADAAFLEIHSLLLNAAKPVVDEKRIYGTENVRVPATPLRIPNRPNNSRSRF